jgi:glc operon protein GlcG
MIGRILLASAVSLASITAASAAESKLALPAKPQLTLAAAQTIADAAQRYATAQGWAASIAVVDAAGYPILVNKMDGATAISAELALRKGKTSALFGGPSINMEKRINDGSPALLALGFTTLAGGEPIIVDKQVIGAVGVSSAVGTHDDPIAVEASHALDGKL